MKKIVTLLSIFSAIFLQAQDNSDTTLNNYGGTITSNSTAVENNQQEKPTKQPKVYGGTEIAMWTGYQTNSNMTFYEGKLRFYGGQNYGIDVVIPVKPIFKVRLGYSRLESEATFFSYFPGLYPDRTSYLINEYYNLGFEINAPKGNLVPFGLFNLGATSYKSDLFGSSNIWAFNLGIGAGAKVFLTDFFGFRLQARALLPFKPQGLSLYASSGGSGVAVNSKAMILADFTFGIFLHLNKK